MDKDPGDPKRKALGVIILLLFAMLIAIAMIKTRLMLQKQ